MSPQRTRFHPGLATRFFAERQNHLGNPSKKLRNRYVRKGSVIPTTLGHRPAPFANHNHQHNRESPVMNGRKAGGRSIRIPSKTRQPRQITAPAYMAKAFAPPPTAKPVSYRAKLAGGAFSRRPMKARHSLIPCANTESRDSQRSSILDDHCVSHWIALMIMKN